MYIEGEQFKLFRHCENRLDAVRKRLTKQRERWLKIPGYERGGVIHPIIASATKNFQFADQFLLRQVGDSETVWGSSTEDKRDLSPLALQRIETACAKRTDVLWPWLLFENESDQNSVKEFLDNYLQIAQLIGLFPQPQQLNNIPLQRMLHPKYRTLATTLIFIKDCIAKPDISSAGVQLLTFVDDTFQQFSQRPIEVLQEIVRTKANLSDEDIQKLIAIQLWTSHEDITMMLIDRGLRDTIFNFYGIFRDV